LAASPGRSFPGQVVLEVIQERLGIPEVLLVTQSHGEIIGVEPEKFVVGLVSQ